MQNSIRIENIEEMRRQEGIEDIELRKKINGLRVGDLVKLTLMTGTMMSPSGETLPVRITSIKGTAFRGKLTNKPVSPGLSEVSQGEPVSFTAAHIHSVPSPSPSRPRPSTATG